MEDADAERNLDYSGSDSPSQVVSGEPMMSLPVRTTGACPAQVKPVAQDVLGSSVMVHQQLRAQP